MAEAINAPSIGAQSTTVSLVALIAACGIFLYVAYLRLLPKPLPGIPYNKSAARSLFGDLPEIMSYMKQTKELWPWVADQTVRHQSAMVQVFGRPFAKPWIVSPPTELDVSDNEADPRRPPRSTGHFVTPNERIRPIQLYSRCLCRLGT